MTGDQIQISPVGCQPLAVVVEAVDLLIRKRDATNGVSPAVVAIFVLIDVISKMDYIVDRVLFLCQF
jgi:hypothetical protein